MNWGMPNLKKQEYYRKNREARLNYQHKWYAENKGGKHRKSEIMQVTDPEEWERVREEKKKYNRAYYLKNRAKILMRQRTSYMAQSSG